MRVSETMHVRERTVTGGRERADNENARERQRERETTSVCERDNE